MQQEQLWHDTIYDALRAAVDAIGGPKKVAAQLWPAKWLEEARRYLLHCLDSERNEKLSLDELMLIGAQARKAGCHTVINFLAQEWGYTAPQPTEPEDQQALLQREWIQAVKALEQITKRQEHMTRLREAS